MSLENYNRLDPMRLKLNSLLPKLHSKTLVRKATKTDLKGVIALVDQLQPNEGWQMYKDRTDVSSELPSVDLIEAQYTDGSDSLHIKLAGNRFIAVQYMISGEMNDRQVVTTQTLLLSNKVKPETEALYQIWYQQTDDKWEAIAQQFIGFCRGVKL